jgi:DNA polymerase-3 subunit gamma/tau
MEKKKKKPANYIIPATFFQALSPAVKEIAKPIEKKIAEVVQKQKIEEPPKAKLKTPLLNTARKRSSSLSLKSVHEKKEVKKLVVEENFDNHPKDVFTEVRLQELWAAYVTFLNSKGERSMASIVGTDVPKLGEDFKISFSIPNRLMLDQFHKGRPALLKYLRAKLNNYGIKIIVTLNETVEKKFAYTPVEKFNKMKEINPLLEKLRQTFELDM